MNETNEKLPRLLIISDTAMWAKKEGIMAFEPVVREIENFEYLFSKITWIGFKQPEDSNKKNARATTSNKLRMVMIPRTGGDTFFEKARTVILFPYIFIVVTYNIFRHKYIHTRNPSIPGFIAVLISIISFRKKFWHKWAGNWISFNHPISYRIQKYFVRIARRATVSVNGVWGNEPPNIINLENPCYTEKELFENNKIGNLKNFASGLKICFVGNLTRPKGILEFLESLKQPGRNIFEEIVIIGDGILRKEAEVIASAINTRVTFRGFLNRKELDKVYAEMHFICLPSSSEGFPKVIAEAMSFGCIPIVTDISCIGQYVKEELNGFLLSDNSENEIRKKLDQISGNTKDQLSEISRKAIEVSKLFTYENYNNKIRAIFNI